MKKELITGMAWGGGIVLLALAATFARNQGYIDQDTVLRIVIGVNGLLIIYYGNRTPKAVTGNACAQRLTRVAGWSLVLSGIVYAGLWAFAPIPVAVAAGTVAVAAGMIVTFGYGLKLRKEMRSERQNVGV
ncbi:ammonium transporter [Allosphingosinicella vermicomposti]|uniref:ammonium transporter n=1 Tax=Allosphingosinicella vermicomposti TaxID=614671 RepID=UPI0018F8A3D0|nr:ammonium transporter [Allosphingosinicella vermicomposti]